MNRKKEQLAQAEKYLAGLQAAAEVGEQIVAKLRRLLDEPAEPEAVKEWPQNGDRFFAVDCNGDVFSATLDIDDTEDIAFKAIGNVFRTEALARRRVEALKVAAELRRMPGRCAGPDGFIARHCIDLFARGFGVNDYDQYKFSNLAIAGVWFESREAAQHALDTIGQDRLGVWLSDYLDEPMGDE